MDQNKQIQDIITNSINIIESEIANVTLKQENEETLSKEDVDKVIDFLKTLIIVQKERRLIAKEEDLDLKKISKDELEEAIEAEINKLNDT